MPTPSEDSVEKSTESLTLDAPSHEDAFQGPVIDTPENNLNNKSEVSIPLVPKKGIEVVALRKGFYNQMRWNEGDKFLIRSEKEFGEWFKCTDSYYEKKRLEFYKEKKAKK